MSGLLAYSRVTFHGSDGFEFLAASESTYDVINNNYWDLVGPAQYLLRKPNLFNSFATLLLLGATFLPMAFLWPYLSLIKELRITTRDLFTASGYA
jgi:spermidine synthase / saccharopine dehydrogenase (NADP+, L-glutamate-forming)